MGLAFYFFHNLNQILFFFRTELLLGRSLNVRARRGAGSRYRWLQLESRDTTQLENGETQISRGQGACFALSRVPASVLKLKINGKYHEPKRVPKNMMFLTDRRAVVICVPQRSTTSKEYRCAPWDTQRN